MSTCPSPSPGWLPPTRFLPLDPHRQECEDIYTELHSITGKRLPVKGDESFTIEVVHYSKDDKTSKSIVQTAIKLFRGSFGAPCPALPCHGTLLAINFKPCWPPSINSALSPSPCLPP
jgi:hypothetical protein